MGNNNDSDMSDTVLVLWRCGVEGLCRGWQGAVVVCCVLLLRWWFEANVCVMVWCGADELGYSTYEDCFKKTAYST